VSSVNVKEEVREAVKRLEAAFKIVSRRTIKVKVLRSGKMVETQVENPQYSNADASRIARAIELLKRCI